MTVFNGPEEGAWLAESQDKPQEGLPRRRPTSTDSAPLEALSMGAEQLEAPTEAPHEAPFDGRPDHYDYRW